MALFRACLLDRAHEILSITVLESLQGGGHAVFSIEFWKYDAFSGIVMNKNGERTRTVILYWSRHSGAL